MKMMFYDSDDWGKDLQIACDLLRSKDGYLGTLCPKDQKHQTVPLYFSNADFIWSNDFPQTRFAQGAFRIALEALYTVCLASPCK
jgi:ribonucleotide monophosphatase NagD (HAD superfamily)